MRCFLWGDAKMKDDIETYKRCIRGGGNILISHPEALKERLQYCKGECT